MLSTFIKERHPKGVYKMTRLAELFIEVHGYSSFIKDQVMSNATVSKINDDQVHPSDQKNRVTFMK